ncbi:hypothetical protein DFJ58DRAFT_641101, partial [Suillus subalutaceus]|uniref:uncharacterized protein n=1 Tax=Suillus subalutaceus TaxID=48586 RepID=UPI001B8700DD
LAGQVRGRSTVCRDLDTDLWRISQVGSRCIFGYCLDDEELEFLGIHWSDYVRSAHRQEWTFFGKYFRLSSPSAARFNYARRMPLLEGLAPLLPWSLDESPTKLMDAYTMRGASILVRCRGGLGKAGLVSYCRVLKVGLCGWINVGI